MDIRKLQRAIVDGLEDVKAQAIMVFNTEQLSPLFERVVVASGSSNRQTKSLAASVRDAVKSRGMEVLRTEGEENGEWIIVDCGAAVCHIMQPTIREYYRLEEIWGGKKVNVKLGEVRALPKAEEPEAAAPAKSAKAPGRAGTAAKAPVAKPPARKAPARRVGAVAKRAAPKSALDKEPVARTVKVASKAVHKRTAAAPAKKAVARKPAARKTATSKAR